MMAFVAAGMALAIVMLFGLGVALLLSAWNVYFRDVSNVVDVLQTVITWTVPMIYPFGIVMDRLQHVHAVVYEIYLSSPLCIAVLLNNRGFWTPSSPTPKIFERQELPTHLFGRGAIMIVVGVAFVFFAQAVFARLEGNFAEKL